LVDTVRRRNLSLRGATRLDQYCIAIVLVVFAFYAIPAGKRSVYLLAAYPALAYCVARLLRSSPDDVWLQMFRVFRMSMGVLVGVVALVLVAGVGGLVGGGWNETAKAVGGAVVSSWYSVPALFMALSLGLLFVIRAGRDQGRKTGVLGVAAYFLVAAAATGVLLPGAAGVLSDRPFGVRLATVVPVEKPLYSFGREFYGLSFYLGRRITTKRSFVAGDIVVVRVADLPALKGVVEPSLRVEVLTEERRLLAPKSSLMAVLLQGAGPAPV
jgi:hypothetical protein